MFSAGALAGAAAALVLTPATGRETRKYLGQRSRAMAGVVAEQGKKVWNEHGERVAEAVRQGYAHATGAIPRRGNGAAESGQGM